jgi:predicted regulator of Ras-like GTPase activity (Roadblock/LC7/MglB family)
MLQRLLASFCQIPGVQFATIIDSIGNELMQTYSSNSQDVSFMDFGNLLQTLDMSSKLFDMGLANQCWIESKNGSIILCALPNRTYIGLLTNENPNLGRLSYELNTKKEAIAQLM